MLAAPSIIAVLLVPYPSASFGLMVVAYVTAETWLGPAAAIVQVCDVTIVIVTIAMITIVIVTMVIVTIVMITMAMVTIVIVAVVTVTTVIVIIAMVVYDGNLFLTPGYLHASNEGSGISCLYWGDHYLCKPWAGPGQLQGI